MSDDPFDARLAELNALMDRSMSRLEAFHSGTNGVLERLEAGQKSLRADFLDELGKTRVELTGKFAEVKGEVSAIRDDIAVNIGSAEAAQRANDNTRADLRALGEQVQIIWKRMITIEADIRELKADIRKLKKGDER
jgi:predicted  nucleic acid-binding Zn-ribbon protein